MSDLTGRLPTPENDIKQGLQECFDNIQSDGSFALFEPLDCPPNPGLYLKNGGGTIGLPLSARDAQAIVAASHAAPFGKGEETIVDTRVRKTWEISSTDFEVRNPAWQTFMQTIVAKVAAGLGVDTTGRGVTAELYKMLLYDEGAMFKAHQDSEKAPRMFATLVVALPSEHTGGEVRVTHAGKTEVFETSQYSEFGFSYLAWFADVTHEVKPVLSGRRLVLTYNLMHTSLQASELTADANKGALKLRNVLRSWMHNIQKDVKVSHVLGYLLEHQYTAASLRVDGLKGHDRQVIANIRDVCDQEGMCLYLANLDIKIEGGCDEDDDEEVDGYHEIIEEIDKTVTLKRVVQLDGIEVAQDLDFDESLFVQNSPLTDQPPDREEDYSGYTGNEGVSATHFYHRTILLVIPTGYRMEFFFPEPRKKKYEYTYWNTPKPEYKPQVATWIEILSADLPENSQVPACHSREFLEHICIAVMQRMASWRSLSQKSNSSDQQSPFSDDEICLVMNIMIDFLKRGDLIPQALDGIPDKNTLALQSIGSALLRYDLRSLLPKLAARLAGIFRLCDRFDFIYAVRRGLNTEAERSGRNMPVFDAWMKSETDKALSTAAVDSAKDGLVLSKLSRTIAAQEIFTKILPVIKRNVDVTPMAVSFIIGIFDSGADGTIPQETAQAVLRDIVADLADGFSLNLLEKSLTNEAKKTTSSFGPFSTTPASQKPIIDTENSKNIAILLCHCQELGLRSELEQIVFKISGQSRTSRMELYEGIFLPFLKILKTMIIEKHIEVKGSPFQTLFQQVLTSYINRFVEAQPQPPKDWARDGVSCGCRDCSTLNKFLLDPRQQVGRFPMSQKRRDHLERTTKSKHPGFKLGTDYRGSPHTLIVTKTNNCYQESLKAWNARRVVARKHLDDIGESVLKVFLGNIHGQIMSMSMSAMEGPPIANLNSADQEPALMSSRNASNRVLPPITKRKVPQEVILIDDD